MHEALAADDTRRRRWSDYCGLDLGEAETLAQLMLKASLVCNPESVILFSSKKPQHIRNNVKLLDDDTTAEASMKLYSLVRGEVNAGQSEARA